MYNICTWLHMAMLHVCCLQIAEKGETRERRKKEREREGNEQKMSIKLIKVIPPPARSEKSEICYFRGHIIGIQYVPVALEPVIGTKASILPLDEACCEAQKYYVDVH